MNKSFYVAMTSVALASFALTGSPAFAATGVSIDGQSPDSNGVYWDVDEYGVADGGDANENYEYVYYPNEIKSGSTYFYCDDNYGNDATLTTEDNGDVTVDCDEQFDVNLGVNYQLHFRFYHESETGYLVRQWLEITNPSNSEVVLEDGFHLYYYWNYYDWSDGDNYVTSQGGYAGAAGDTWSAGSDLVGDTIATTAAWAGSCSTEDFTPNVGYDFPDSYSTIPANAGVNLVTYFNIYFPSNSTPEAASAAYEVVKSQAAEYDSFSGRLTAGLPTGEVFAGWTDGSCDQPEELASTGTPDSAAGGFALGLGGLAAGALVTIIRRRRNS